MSFGSEVAWTRVHVFSQGGGYLGIQRLATYRFPNVKSDNIPIFPNA